LGAGVVVCQKKKVIVLANTQVVIMLPLAFQNSMEFLPDSNRLKATGVSRGQMVVFGLRGSTTDQKRI